MAKAKEKKKKGAGGNNGKQTVQLPKTSQEKRSDRAGVKDQLKTLLQNEIKFNKA